MADRLTDHTVTAHHDPAFAAVSRAAFPGGKVRLPKLSGDERGPMPTVDFVGTAFVGGGTATIEEPPEPVTETVGFTEYFSYESLFATPPADAVPSPDDAYDVLGVTHDTPWPAIVSAHRALVKEFHPDRFVGEPAAVIAEAEDRIRRVNAAYADLQRMRASAGGAERRSGGDRRGSQR